MTDNSVDLFPLWKALTRGADTDVLAAVEQLKGLQRRGLIGMVEAVARHIADAANGRHEGSRQCDLVSKALVAVGNPSATAIVDFMFLRLLKPGYKRDFFGLTADIGHHSSTASWPVIREIWWLFDEIPWTPKNDEDTARYWCARCMFENCIPLGKYAISSLAEVLAHGYSDFPSSAGYTLASLKNVDDRTIRDGLAALGCGSEFEWVLNARHLAGRHSKYHNAVVKALMPHAGDLGLNTYVQGALRDVSSKYPIAESEQLSYTHYTLLARAAYEGQKGDLGPGV